MGGFRFDGREFVRTLPMCADESGETDYAAIEVRYDLGDGAE